MMKNLILIVFLMILPISGMTTTKSEMRETNQLMVIWSSGDPDVALKVCFMYTHAAKKMKWFKQVHLIVWGPSAKLLTQNEELQIKLKQMKDDGVVLEACVNCAKMYGVADKLSEMGIDVKAMGKPLTQRLKDDWKQLNF